MFGGAVRKEIGPKVVGIRGVREGILVVQKTLLFKQLNNIEN